MFNKNKECPLMIAVSGSNTEAVKLLCESGAKTDVLFEKQTVLHIAVKRGISRIDLVSNPKKVKEFVGDDQDNFSQSIRTSYPKRIISHRNCSRQRRL